MIVKKFLQTRSWSITNCSQITLKRYYAVVVPDENFVTAVSNDEYKPRNHPGRVESRVVTIPDTFVKAVLNTVEDYPVKGLVEAANKFYRHLQGRQLPLEQEVLQMKVKKIQTELMNNHKNVELCSEEDERRFAQKFNDKLKNRASKEIYNWRPTKYDSYTSLVYLLARAPAEYAVLMRIFGEIFNRDKEFTPKSLFDFGSGVGTVTWAANFFWKKHIFEYMNIDVSAEMNDLAQILLQGGKGNAKSAIKGTFYRQFLPASNISYDIVVSAYTLMELPTLEMRLETVLNLWNKTQSYLVIVEQGTNAGYNVVNEVRDFLLQLDSASNKGHIFSPCPHDKICPRFLANDGTPCNFNVRYWTMPISKKPDIVSERYSYVVLKKGDRSENQNWPRIVRPSIVKARHTHCKLCTANGQLSQVVFTKKKQGKATYHCVRSSKWGDLLPLTLCDSDNSVEISKEDIDEK